MYDAYWTSDDRIGESSGNPQRTADQIVATCGRGRVLDVGSGEGALVFELLKRGVDAYGLDVSTTVLSRSSRRAPFRFLQGSILGLPFGDDAFETIISTDCFEHLAPGDVPRALSELYRVAKRFVFLRVATTPDRDGRWHLTVEGRQWWETKCFEAGFRKHPAYYRINAYESLNDDAWQIVIPLEKAPRASISKYPLTVLSQRRDLHMDMLRDSGERSDAHVIRYHWAGSFVKPGDRVLDAACGLGYGSHVIRSLTGAASVTGIDASDYAIDYAAVSFSRPAIEYRRGLLPDALASFEDNSFDTIISFETLEHVEDPQRLLREFHRLLTPGGRIVVSVPNDWSDETGLDPNPHHLHVYNWERLKKELCDFVLEMAVAQTASQCKVPGPNGARWERRRRSFRSAPLSTATPPESEWVLIAAMKSPVHAVQPYVERVIPNIEKTGHPSGAYRASYANPWLAHAIVNADTRLKNEQALSAVASEALAAAPVSTNDYAAALCVLAYRAFESRLPDPTIFADLLSRIQAVLGVPATDPMSLRWRVSLLFVQAKLFLATGRFAEARGAFKQCGSHDVRPFGIHLATKTTEAWWLAGRVAYSAGDTADARCCWELGVEQASMLLSASADDILINRSCPNFFNHGDGVREYTLCWDNVARCANGLRVLAEGDPRDENSLDACFQTEYAIVTRDLLDARAELRMRSRELSEIMTLLQERTAVLDQRMAELIDRTRELVALRQVLIERTALLEASNRELKARTDELVELRRARHKK